MVTTLVKSVSAQQEAKDLLPSSELFQHYSKFFTKKKKLKQPDFVMQPTSQDYADKPAETMRPYVVSAQDLKYKIVSFIDKSHRNFGIHNHDVIVPTPYLQQDKQLIINIGQQQYRFTYGGIMESKMVDRGMFYAHTPHEIFVSAKDGHRFMMQSPDFGIRTFTFVKRYPDLSCGEFNSLHTLMEAISFMPGMAARIQENQLYVASEDSSQGLYFENCDTTPFKDEIGLISVDADQTGNQRYSTPWRLMELINQHIPFIHARLNQGVYGCEISLQNEKHGDPLDITFL